MSSFAARTIPFASRVMGTHAKEILTRDKARAQKLLKGVNAHGPSRFREARKRGHHGHTGGGHPDTPSGGDTNPPTSSESGVDVTDAGVTYTTSVGVGNPPTQYTLLIDTGSSNTWLGAATKYVKTSTSSSTGFTVNVSYGSGSFSGNEFVDRVTLSPSLVIEKQSIGVATSAQGFNDVDGILGIGPVDLTEGTVSNNKQVPTVADNLFAQGTITSNSIGIFYEPTTSDAAVNGELTFGDIDSTKITGEVGFVPVTSTSPASSYWGIDQDLTYGTNTSLLEGSAGIVDTGTTLLMIASDAFAAYQRATGAKMDNSTGLLTITQSQFNKLQSLFFNIGGVQYELTPNAQIWPRALNSTIGGEAGKIYLVTADMGSDSGQGLDFINGFAFLQRFYSVYDTGNAQVGLATTPFTNAETN